LEEVDGESAGVEGGKNERGPRPPGILKNESSRRARGLEMMLAKQRKEGSDDV
jgi:hypothetical protein